ncbi:MAG: PTS system, galactitol-specific enzyme II, B component [Caldanaerobacter subterraneus]|uniref:PTS system, galactitol-specific enzyme II, B component n=4 Tax=Caldanaerobacter subterraneus TaxID=911092 RepID=Q8RD65_CALS4|nr:MULTISPECIES: PTS sugar transporter subunit IIB [Caldanaerobacter]ERM92634.1 PTS galactitol transporter subunit IIB [Caldanaerobacter subterraneus subsp. yonseiensis KB-1]AAM23483.1 PTS system, galactitol-specific enzyme II, B component [Caldanaerobacter subterraneus subsp. tengcongensis MB4]KUK07901.1 MAG: PTS system, galactitol-specific enzyme II, B component [Caldanaerobacter subterraneus]MCS3917038.1 PTS system galactitol-specific IIB component [Caldanaerobacter subterraneus subsp. tengc
MVSMRKKTILVACGTGIATSTVVTEKILEAAKKENLDVNIIQCKVSEIKSYAEDADFIVTTTILKDSFGKKSINALPLITGIGEEQVLKEIIEEIKK